MFYLITLIISLFNYVSAVPLWYGTELCVSNQFPAGRIDAKRLNVCIPLFSLYGNYSVKYFPVPVVRNYNGLGYDAVTVQFHQYYGTNECIGKPTVRFDRYSPTSCADAIANGYESAAKYYDVMPSDGGTSGAILTTYVILPLYSFTT
jgi:hypothetical protein